VIHYTGYVSETPHQATRPVANREETPVAFRTITAKYEGVCKRCTKAGLEGVIEVGETIRWAPGAGSYHLATSCPASESYEGDAMAAFEDEMAAGITVQGDLVAAAAREVA
jgi:hypothetical protein